MDRELRVVLSARVFSDQKCFGPGVSQLLKRVDELHSLRAAALSMSMAYSKAWTVVRNAEDGLGFHLLTSTAGGKHGGGAQLTEQGEVIFARYGNPVLAIRHVESVAAATLLQSAPSVEKRNTDMTKKYADMASKLDEAAHNRFLDLLNTDGFAPWFSTVTPLTEIGLLPIGSRPAKRGLGAKSLDDLRTIPWIFSWAQARINLAAWYGLGTACEKFGDLDTLRKAYEEWPLFSTFIDNIEMSIAKTDERIARMYLDLDDREDLPEKVLTEMKLTRKWVLAIVGDKWPLQHRHVLGRAVRIRSPYVDVLSLTQVLALKSLRKKVDKEELSHGKREGYTYLILCTVSGVAAGLQNTG